MTWEGQCSGYTCVIGDLGRSLGLGSSHVLRELVPHVAGWPAPRVQPLGSDMSKNPRVVLQAGWRCWALRGAGVGDWSGWEITCTSFLSERGASVGVGARSLCFWMVDATGTWAVGATQAVHVAAHLVQQSVTWAVRTEGQTAEQGLGRAPRPLRGWWQFLLLGS